MKRFTTLIVCGITILSVFYPQCIDCKGFLPYAINLQLPYTNANIPGYYKGFKLPLNEGRALLPECKSPLVFSLVITTKLSFSMRDRTVSSLIRNLNTPCAWYDITLVFKTENNDDGDEETHREYSWIIEKKSLDDVPKRLPIHAIVLLIDPQFIEDVVDKETTHTPDIINLPTIVFKELTTKQLVNDFENALVVAAMNGLDLDAIHSKERPACFANSSAITTIL
ncbi:MAG: hypothetical protein UV38_C0003G0183 [candidate division TM6 bacterium GW2011_GWE2_42_60]|nr:MAG: hypothetical protein UV38_C0003G0183 [candidate division TM6 bacterium GW2011_GWE2_42_60]HBY05342.1 hypothetical protein [Candidatus Dependentiae bacterium]